MEHHLERKNDRRENKETLYSVPVAYEFMAGWGYGMHLTFWLTYEEKMPLVETPINTAHGLCGKTAFTANHYPPRP